jgi:hypothetical protein
LAGPEGRYDKGEIQQAFLDKLVIHRTSLFLQLIGAGHRRLAAARNSLGACRPPVFAENLQAGAFHAGLH